MKLKSNTCPRCKEPLRLLVDIWWCEWCGLHILEAERKRGRPRKKRPMNPPGGG